MKDIDPLTLAMLPPPSETPEERRVREQNERHAAEVSSHIDEEIRLEKAVSKKRKKPIKVLVLGQSDSGKSTTIKNFQRILDPQSWNSERVSWRPIIFLNLVHSVNTILDILKDEMSKSDSNSPDMLYGVSSSNPSDRSQNLFTPRHKLLKMLLGPLYQIQNDLENLLGASPCVPMTSSIDNRDILSTPEKIPISREVRIISQHGWKSALDKVREESGSPSPEHKTDDAENRRTRSPRLGRAATRMEDIADVISGCAAHIKSLWEDAVVQNMLKKHELALEDLAGFFLNHVDRIAHRDYIPTDEDIMHARLQTMGVQEYRFHLANAELKADLPQEWMIYDVAGIRTSRAAWVPFFEDIQSIIFLAPVSAFDQVLAEDRSVNRIQDSLSLWTSVCTSKILKKVQLILLLNKCDVLRRKLKQGKKISDCISGFSDKGNDYEAVLKQFSHMFQHNMLKHNPKRPFYAHFTSVVDAKTTAVTLGSVQDSIVRHMMADAGLI